MRFLIVVLVFFAAVPAYALSTDGLTDTQIAQLRQQVAIFEIENAQIEEAKPSEVEQIAKFLKSLSNELDIPVHDLMNSDLGFMLATKMFMEINREVVDRVIGIIWLLVGLGFWWMVWKSIHKNHRVTEYVRDKDHQLVADSITGEWVVNTTLDVGELTLMMVWASLAIVIIPAIVMLV